MEALLGNNHPEYLATSQPITARGSATSALTGTDHDNLNAFFSVLTYDLASKYMIVFCILFSTCYM